jgi:hypothetical protein
MEIFESSILKQQNLALLAAALSVAVPASVSQGLAEPDLVILLVVEGISTC